MPDLIIHIGFPKCASTTLQNQVFNNVEGYLGQHNNLRLEEDLAEKFKSFTPTGPRQWSNFHQAKKWGKEICQMYSKEINRLVLSKEDLSNRNIFSSYPIVSFLKKFSNEVWTYGDVKVIVVLRNYAERMASSYAQGCEKQYLAGQSHFEKYVDIMLAKNDERDYFQLISRLFEDLGKENVCVLLMEEIESIEFWTRLKIFCDFTHFEPESISISSMNKKRKSKDSWVINPFKPEAKANMIFYNLFGFLWPKSTFPRLRKKVIRISQIRLLKYYQKKYSNVNLNREHSFELTNELRQRIQSHFIASTKELSALLGKDMSALGY
jgi:hypothetical protein